MKDDSLFRLERSGLQALREYAPGSQIVAGDRLVRSHGLLKRWDANGNLAQGQELHWARGADGVIEFSRGGAIAQTQDGKVPTEKGMALLVKGGFAVPNWLPPVHRFETEDIGEIAVAPDPSRPAGAPDPVPVNLGGVKLSAEYDEVGSLLAMNNGEHDRGFAICKKCGYADSQRISGAFPRGFDQHASMTSRSGFTQCGYGKLDPWIGYALAAKQETNLLRLSPQSGTWSTQIAETVAIALALEGTRFLGVDAREIGALSIRSQNGFDALLYDNNPGGSGMLRDLCDDAVTWVKMAYNLLYGDAAHHERCRHGCIRCVLGFSTQFKVMAGGLDRIGATQALAQAL